MSFNQSEMSLAIFPLVWLVSPSLIIKPWTVMFILDMECVVRCVISHRLLLQVSGREAGGRN